MTLTREQWFLLGALGIALVVIVPIVAVTVSRNEASAVQVRGVLRGVPPTVPAAEIPDRVHTALLAATAVHMYGRSDDVQVHLERAIPTRHNCVAFTAHIVPLERASLRRVHAHFARNARHFVGLLGHAFALGARDVATTPKVRADCRFASSPRRPVSEAGGTLRVQQATTHTDADAVDQVANRLQSVVSALHVALRDLSGVTAIDIVHGGVAGTTVTSHARLRFADASTLEAAHTRLAAAHTADTTFPVHLYGTTAASMRIGGVSVE
jgi:hypothetical protein